MDYGTGTVCNGRTISGKTILSLSAPHRSVGSVITQTFDNFKINLHKIEGTRTRTNNTVTGGAPTFTLTMTNGKVTDPDGKTFTWNATHTRTWVAGFETNTASDNIVDITGTATGVNRNGKAFTATVLNAVRMSYACRYPLQGTVKVTRTGLNDRTIDFGTGACDGTATVTVNGTTHTVNLPGR